MQNIINALTSRSVWLQSHQVVHLRSLCTECKYDSSEAKLLSKHRRKFRTKTRKELIYQKVLRGCVKEGSSQKEEKKKKGVLGAPSPTKQGQFHLLTDDLELYHGRFRMEFRMRVEQSAARLQTLVI